MLTRIAWELPADASNVAFCRRAVRLLLDHNCISDADIDEVELIVGELCGNVVRHAYDTHDGCLVVSVELDGTELDISVQDSGRGFDSSSIQQDPSFSETGGMGLFLMRAFADGLHIRRGHPTGSAVTATRHLHKRSEPQRSYRLRTQQAMT